MPDVKPVIVAGDLIWDNNLVRKPRTPSYYSDTTNSTELHRRAGAWYLKDALGWAFGNASDVEIKLGRGAGGIR
jgi:hypothetical protein